MGNLLQGCFLYRWALAIFACFSNFNLEAILAMVVVFPTPVEPRKKINFVFAFSSNLML